MKRLLMCLGAAGAIAALGGCAVVPYNAGYVNSPYDGVYTQGYAPVYAGPPAPVYVGPPVYFGFGLNYRSGGHHGHGFRGGHRGRH